ncbi:MAG: zinc finger domain-containing protein [Methanocellales archaeon]|nr:zinc finger domain-containing protein [Methanocellales archaeon]
MSKPKKAEGCISCGVKLVEPGFARFPCPNCGEEMGRCVKCRKQSNPYRCKCGFVGP